mmetsp:Transcript_8812/g.23595  ORF Transcript_8812/g.23595 Transcript_8812/m.23595 type:complete len:291 (+) Transcript_8812:229-1101(+)
MRDDEGGLSHHQRVDRLLHDVLVLAVERARRLVQEQHLGVANDGAGDRDALLLAARDPRSPLAGVRLVPMRQVLNEVVGVCSPRGLLHQLEALSVRGAVGDVVFDAAIEEHWLLLDEADLRPKPPHAQLSIVQTVQRQPAARGVIVAQKEAAQGGLPGAALAHQRDDVPWFGIDVHASQDLAIGTRPVREADVFDAQPSLAGRWLLALAHRDGRLALEQLHKLACGHDNPSEVHVDVHAIAEAILIETHVLLEGSEDADRHLAIDDQPHRIAQHQAITQLADEVRDRVQR